MKTGKLTTLILALALLAIGGIFAVQNAEAKGRGEKKPIDFTLTDTTGKTVKLSDYRGKVVVVDFWATWCGYCVHEIPDLIALQKQADKDKMPLQVLGIAIDKNKADVTNFVQVNAFSYPVLYAEPNAMQLFGDLPGVPTKFVITDQGVIAEKIVGARTKSELLKVVQKYLPKTVSATKSQ